MSTETPPTIAELWGGAQFKPAFRNYNQLIHAKKDMNARESIVHIPIDELRDLLLWLLLKEGVSISVAPKIS